jgi:type I restriction enzyme, S subunit
MSEWRQLTLEEAGIRLIDCVHKTPSAAEIGMPYVAIPEMRGGEIDLSSARKISKEDFAEWTRKAKPEPFDVVLSRRCNPGETAFVRPGMTFALGQNLVLLRADGTSVNRPFLRWLVRTPEWWNEVERYRNVGAVFDSLRCADVPNFRLSIPPLDEQKEISSLLGALDDKIELNRQTNATLEAMARALFKDWFVDFGPTRAKAEGHAPYLAPHLWELFPDALDDEDKPVGWEVQTLSDISSLNPDTWSAKKHPSQVNYVDLSNVKWGTIEATQRYVWADAPSRARRVLYPADTIVGTVRPGNGSYALIGEDGLTGSTGFAVLRPNGSNLRELVYCAATAPENIERLSHLADGAAYPAVRPDVVSATEFVRGNDDISSAFSELTAPLIDRLEANKQESRTLAQTRDLLLPKLMSGEIRLREAERVIEEAV